MTLTDDRKFSFGFILGALAGSTTLLVFLVYFFFLYPFHGLDRYPSGDYTNEYPSLGINIACEAYSNRSVEGLESGGVTSDSVGTKYVRLCEVVKR